MSTPMSHDQEDSIRANLEQQKEDDTESNADDQSNLFVQPMKEWIKSDKIYKQEMEARDKENDEVIKQLKNSMPSTLNSTETKI